MKAENWNFMNVYALNSWNDGDLFWKTNCFSILSDSDLDSVTCITDPVDNRQLRQFKWKLNINAQPLTNKTTFNRFSMRMLKNSKVFAHFAQLEIQKSSTKSSTTEKRISIYGKSISFIRNSIAAIQCR